MAFFRHRMMSCLAMRGSLVVERTGGQQNFQRLALLLPTYRPLSRREMGTPSGLS
jgi:hypothetical protein